jgi:mono/diheme cytochrome c family protein
MSAFRLFCLSIALVSAPLLAQEPFTKAGVAFLDRHCVSCHGKDKQKADLAVHLYRDDASLKPNDIADRFIDVFNMGLRGRA